MIRRSPTIGALSSQGSDNNAAAGAVSKVRWSMRSAALSGEIAGGDTAQERRPGCRASAPAQRHLLSVGLVGAIAALAAHWVARLCGQEGARTGRNGDVLIG